MKSDTCERVSNVEMTIAVIERSEERNRLLSMPRMRARNNVSLFTTLLSKDGRLSFFFHDTIKVGITF